MDKVSYARALLKALIEKYQVKLTKKQFAEIQLLYDNAMRHDPTGTVWLKAVLNTETLLERQQ